MADASKHESDKQFGIFYDTEEQFVDEAKRFLHTRRKNRGATEWQIWKVAQTRPFVTALEQTKASGVSKYFLTKKEELSYMRGLRRHAVFRTIKKLLDEGDSVAEIADALTLPYSTAYYYAKKIRNHQRLREERTRWHLDESKEHIVSIRLPRDKEAVLAREETMRKAKEKRERKLARRSASGCGFRWGPHD